MGSLKSFGAKNPKPFEFNWDFVNKSLLDLNLALQEPPKHLDGMIAYHYKFKHLLLILTADMQARTYLIKWELMGPIGPGYSPQFRDISGTLDSEENLVDEITSVVVGWQELGKRVYPNGW
jgi:hypothetical protein